MVSRVLGGSPWYEVKYLRPWSARRGRLSTAARLRPRASPPATWWGCYTARGQCVLHRAVLVWKWNPVTPPGGGVFTWRVGRLAVPSAARRGGQLLFHRPGQPSSPALSWSPRWWKGKGWAAATANHPRCGFPWRWWGQVHRPLATRGGLCSSWKPPGGVLLPIACLSGLEGRRGGARGGGQ